MTTPVWSCEQFGNRTFRTAIRDWSWTTNSRRQTKDAAMTTPVWSCEQFGNRTFRTAIRDWSWTTNSRRQTKDAAMTTPVWSCEQFGNRIFRIPRRDWLKRLIRPFLESAGRANSRLELRRHREVPP